MMVHSMLDDPDSLLVGKLLSVCLGRPGGGAYLNFYVGWRPVRKLIETTIADIVQQCAVKTALGQPVGQHVSGVYPMHSPSDGLK